MLSYFRVSIKLSHISKITLCNLRHHSTTGPVITKTRISQERDYSPNSQIARSNWLITKLSREGKISEARKVFDEMPEKDVITWTAVITGYIKCELIEEARRLFDRVDSRKNVVTWTAMVGGYMRLKRVIEADQLFWEMPIKNVVSWNIMIDGYIRNGMIDMGLKIFNKMSEKNVVSWNTIITAMAQCGRIEEAKGLFDMMPKRDVISWTTMVAGLARNGRVDEARLVFDRMPERNVVSWNAMVTGYAWNMRLDEAFDLFERMPERNLPSWNTMITGFIENGEFRRARELFDMMPEKNVVSWTAMISGYVKDGQSEEALKVFLKMLMDARVRPNEGTYVTILSACSDLAGLCEGQQIHQMISKTVYQGNTFVLSALINMYSKCGVLSTARKIFDEGLLSKRDLVSWNGMIAAYAHHGRGREAINLFNQMQDLGFKPDDVTYVGLLSACSHAGLVNDGRKYFNDLVKDTSIKIREDHYACFVDLCGRAGRVKEAYDFIEQLGCKPSASVWGALLAGCNVHGDLNIGKHAAKELSEMEPENAGSYLLLSNIYASTGKWRDAARVRLKMKDKGLKKQPGCSWIEVGNRVHVFVVGDKSHCQAKPIYFLLGDLHAQMKKVGPVSNNDDLVT
ncbi:hypothetical protein LWI29_028752 [Acer saccharum]|uniref:Pentatricopeptide repeat-containing protein n=1 Tax=Acer saccharum TaxID=4024 RepID=A0AA39W0P4_ACESA|nr:hypothetical protein LWI29_028752 [Acer saccharum]